VHFSLKKSKQSKRVLFPHLFSGIGFASFCSLYILLPKQQKSLKINKSEKTS